MKARLLLITSILFTSVLLVGCASNQPTSNKAAIATSHPLATQAGFRALDQGGNAFDAAVAASAVLSVVAPYGAGLGGGSFWLLQNRNGTATFVDAREVSPQQISPLNKVHTASFLNSTLSTAIPGNPAALAHISHKYGIRPLAANLADAIHIATRGFRVDKQYDRYVSERLSALQKQPSSPFLHQGNIPIKGSVITQPELAKTLTQLGRKGHKGFYQGEIANRLVSDLRKAGGVWTLQDLQDYAVIERPAISFNYKYGVITSSPPPSYGGIALQQTLKIFERFDTHLMSREEKADLITRIMLVTSPDTAIWLGDPDFLDISIEQLTSSPYLSSLAEKISPNKVTKNSLSPSSEIKENEAFTPHISILDKWGNKASLSLSMNMPFGSSFTSQSTGVLLNNSLASFTANTRLASNALEPGKRPASYMTPTLVETSGSTVIIGLSKGKNTASALISAVLDYMNGEPTDQWGREYNLQEFKPSLTDAQIIRSDKATGNIEAFSSSAGGGQAIVR